MIEDGYKWRKCVHGVANPQIEDAEQVPSIAYFTFESLVCWSFGDLGKMGCLFVCCDSWSGRLTKALGSTETAKSPAFLAGISEVHSSCRLFPIWHVSQHLKTMNNVVCNVWIS